jgi:ABC-type antimicrobial peptide transport system permease subunit
LAGIFGRVLVQVGAGAAGGVLVALLIQHYIPIEEMDGWNIPGILPAAAAFMIVVGLLAVVGPARRALRVEPSNALREG